SEGDPPRHVTETAAIGGELKFALAARTISCANAPEVATVPNRLVRVTLAVILLQQDSAPRVFKVVAALLLHKRVADAAKVNPGMRKQVRKQWTGVKHVLAEYPFPLISHRPGGERARGQGARAGTQAKDVEDQRLVIALPPVGQKTKFRQTALRQRACVVLRPAPVDPFVKCSSNLTYFTLDGAIEVQSHRQ